MRLIPLGVAVVAATLYFTGLGDAPFFDPPEGFHAEIAREMLERGDYVTLRLNGVRYLDKPPLVYWLVASAFSIGGPSPFAARLWAALAAVGCAAVTARLGMLMAGPRVGLLAGLMTAANLGFYVFGRHLKPDTVLIFCIMLAFTGFIAAYLGRGGRWGLPLFYAALGLATLAKDVLGAVGPLAAVAIFFWVTRERPLGPWLPWWGAAIFAAIAVPWYLAVEAANRGFLWYTLVDQHLLAFAGQRLYPDEDVPLGMLEFLAVTAAAFLPWTLALPWALSRVFRRPWTTPVDRAFLLLGIWAVLVVGVFALSPFKLPHYGLPAFPALALLVARVWDETMSAEDGAPRIRPLLAPILVVFALCALGAGLVWTGVVPGPEQAMEAFDVASRNRVAQGQVPVSGGAVFRPLLGSVTAIFGLATAGLAIAAWRRRVELGLLVALGAAFAMLPVVGTAMTRVAEARSARPIAEALLMRAGPDDTVFHEGALENSASVLLVLERPVLIVDGTVSNLAFGSTFADARGVFLSADRVREAWSEPGRRFLISAVPPEWSLVRGLPEGSVHLVAEAAGRRLYSNLPP